MASWSVMGSAISLDPHDVGSAPLQRADSRARASHDMHSVARRDGSDLFGKVQKVDFGPVRLEPPVYGLLVLTDDELGRHERGLSTILVSKPSRLGGAASIFRGQARRAVSLSER